MGLEAISIARGADDPGALAAALIGRWYAIQRPDGFEERRRIVDELLALGDSLHDRDLSLQSQSLRARVAAESGDMEELGAAITEHGKLADQSKQPGNQLHTRAYRATRALSRGRFDEVESLAAEVIELGMLAQSPGALHYSAVELIVLRWEQGRMDEVEEPLREMYERTGAPVWRAALAMLAGENDDFERTRAELEALSADGFAAIPFDANWLAAMTFLSMACVHVGDAGIAAELFETLQPYRERVAVVGAGAACLGPVSHFLGLLAAVQDRRDDAVGLFEDAADASRRAGSEPWLARANFRLGLVLRERGEASDRTRADQLLAESQATARRLEMGRLLKIAERARGAARSGA
jgi:hypothetical protein